MKVHVCILSNLQCRIYIKLLKVVWPKSTDQPDRLLEPCRNESAGLSNLSEIETCMESHSWSLTPDSVWTVQQMLHETTVWGSQVTCTSNITVWQ